jgi:protein-tyrosine phosphatase
MSSSGGCTTSGIWAATRPIDGRTVQWGRLFRSDSLRYPAEIEAKGRVPDGDGLAYHNLSIEHRPYDQARAGFHRRARPVPGRAIHCASGKDRTGIVAALVLGLLGVGEDDIVADFALTERATDRADRRWAGRQPNRQLIWPGYGRAPAEPMRRFRSDLATVHGSIRGYAVDRLGVDEEQVTAP